VLAQLVELYAPLHTNPHLWIFKNSRIQDEVAKHFSNQSARILEFLPLTSKIQKFKAAQML
jgi:hypothetical protein